MCVIVTWTRSELQGLVLTDLAIGPYLLTIGRSLNGIISSSSSCGTLNYNKYLV